MTFALYNCSNMDVGFDYESVDLVFADYVYENTNFDWFEFYYGYTLRKNGVLIAMTDDSSLGELIVYGKSLGANLVNILTWRNDWGNKSNRKFRAVSDYVVIFSKGLDYKFYADRVQVPKITASAKGLNPSKRETKTATSCIDDCPTEHCPTELDDMITDCVLTTVSKERIKKDDGHLVRWQKPLKLVRRLITPFVDAGDLIVDPFMGVATSGIVARELNCSYRGIELDPEVYALAKNRLEKHENQSKEKLSQLEMKL